MRHNNSLPFKLQFELKDITIFSLLSYHGQENEIKKNFTIYLLYKHQTMIWFIDNFSCLHIIIHFALIQQQQ